MFDTVTCRTSVSLWEAVLFGAGEACISLSVGSIMSLVALFVLAVITLKLAATFVITRLIGSHYKRKKAAIDAAYDARTPPPIDDGPIRSTR